MELINPVLLVTKEDATDEEKMEFMSSPQVAMVRNLYAICQRLDLMIQLGRPRVPVDMDKILKPR